MSTAIKKIVATYRRGLLEPEEPLALTEGEKVTLVIEPQAPLSEDEKLRRFRSSAGSWKGVVDDDLEEYLLTLRRLKTRPEIEPWQ